MITDQEEVYKKIKILITTGYLIYWFYILYKSFRSLKRIYAPNRTILRSIVMTVPKTKALLYKYILIFLGFLTFISYIWFRFLRTRWMTGLVSLIHTLQIIEDLFSRQSIYLDFVTYVVKHKDLFIVDIIYKRRT